ncbi:MAG: hypothetical protein V3U87_03565 [Methylococcaceae bacterium]
MKEKLCVSIIIIATIGGIYFIATGIGYIYDYFTDITATRRNEYIGGAILSTVISLPFWLVVSRFSFPIRNMFSITVYWALNTPSIILGVSFIVMNIYILFMAVMGK